MARNHPAEDRKRNERARKIGFRSRAQQRRHPRRARNRADVDALPLAAQEARLASFDAMANWRSRSGVTIDDVAAEAGTNPDAMKWFGIDAVYREGGKWRVTRADRLLRTMRVNSRGDVVVVDVRGSRKASELGAYHAAVYRYLHTGDDDALQRFAGKSVAGVPYETNGDALEEMWRRGDLSVEDIYQLVAA